VQLLRVKALGALLIIALAAAATAAAHANRISLEDTQFQRWLVHYLKSDSTGDDDLQNLVYGYALVDLNGDEKNEAVVWARDANLCGTGGCGLDVFVHGKSGWRFFARGPTTRPPIKILPTRSHGWRDLATWQYGGGIDHPFELWVRFDGHDYGFATAASKVPQRVKGRVIIRDATIPLFPSKCRRVQEMPSIFGPMPITKGGSGTC
jgi:hypothetical protein